MCILKKHFIKQIIFNLGRMARIKTNIGGGSLSEKAKHLNNNNKKRIPLKYKVYLKKMNLGSHRCTLQILLFFFFKFNKLGFVVALHCQMMAAIFLAIKYFLVKVQPLFHLDKYYCILNRLQYSINITSICTRKPSKLCLSALRDLLFAVV